jgi:hypothetical protein
MNAIKTKICINIIESKIRFSVWIKMVNMNQDEIHVYMRMIDQEESED